MAVSRNDPCPCGSGKRYKHCHGRMGPSDVTRPADVLAYGAVGADDERERVDFVVAGTQRGGTTSLDQYLRGHPGFDMPRTRKELHFFDHDEHFRGADASYAGYHAHFGPRAPGRLRGEVTPSYMYNAMAAERLARYNPALKIVVLLRNPIARAYSHWNKERERGRETLAFMDALRAEEARTRAAPGGRAGRIAYAGRGDYVGQLERLARHFPPEQILILRSEALQTQAAATLAAIAGFLGVAPFAASAPRADNAMPYLGPMPEDAHAFLLDRFAAEIRSIERLLGWDCAAWLDRGAATGTPG